MNSRFAVTFAGKIELGLLVLGDELVPSRFKMRTIFRDEWRTSFPR